MQAYTEIITSESDKRQYKCIQLENGLRAILIQDDEADKSCAALDVHVGCSLDPKPLYGTAHFLEHMLFMGTEKYPSENEYAEFITNNGGYNNAFTSLVDTNYHFEVSNEAFGEALDRFAQFFLCPLLGEGQTDREMNAVDSEYNMSLQNDAWRKFNLIQNIAHEDSQLRRFNCGNLESLKQPQIRESLLNFHKTWYSSNIMNLVLYGNHSLEKMEQWATSLFAGVENKNVVVPDLSKPCMPFDSSNLGQIAKFQPVKDKDTIELYWVLPHMASEYKAGPLSYFSHLIGHEGENSLLSYLKKEDYAMDLSAGGSSELDCMSDFSVTVTLTKKGLANYEKVIDAVFKYVQRLKEVGPQQWVFDETRNVGQLSFKFLEKGEPMNYAVSLARQMPEFQTPEDVSQLIRHKFIADEFKPELLTSIVDVLANPTGCLVLLASKSLEDASLPIHEKWYKFNYSLEKFTETRINELKTASVPDNGKKLDLPPPNNLIAKSFDILPEDASMSARPQLVQQWDGIADLWYKKDDKFKKPKGIVGCKIYTADLGFGTSADATVFTTVWKNMLTEMLREFTYMADCAKLTFNASTLRDNIDLQWTGFNDALPNFVGETLQKISDFKNADCEDIFNQVKETTVQNWKNYYLNQVFRLAFSELDTFLYESDQEKKHLVQILESFTYAQFKAMQAQWLVKGRMVWYAYGNLSKDQSKQIVENAVNLMGLQSVSKDDLPPVRLIDLSSQSQNFHRVDITVPEPTNENSCFVSFFQHSLDSDKDGGKKSLLNTLVMQFMQEPTFDQLRTKEQLGYVVFSRPRAARAILGAWFLIQSPGKNCTHIRTRMDKHLVRMRAKVQAISDEDFKTNVGAVMTSISEKDKNLREDFGRVWSELSTHAYAFDRQETEIATLPTVTKAEFQAHFEQLFFQENRANRFDMHWNSQPHIKQESEPAAAASTEESKEPTAAEAEAAASDAAEPVPTYDTERKHTSCNAFKKSMGLFVDKIKVDFAAKNFSL